MRPYILSGNREVLIDTPKVKMYYGQEETDPLTGDYCFVVYKNGKEVFRRTNAELLDVACGESPVDMFVAGMALFHSK